MFLLLRVRNKQKNGDHVSNVLQIQNRRQEVFARGALRFCRGGLDIENLIKSPIIYCVSYFDLGGLVLCLGGLSPSKRPPRGDVTV